MNIERPGPTKHGAFPCAPRPDSHQLTGPAAPTLSHQLWVWRVCAWQALDAHSHGSIRVLAGELRSGVRPVLPASSALCQSGGRHRAGRRRVGPGAGAKPCGPQRVTRPPWSDASLAIRHRTRSQRLDRSRRGQPPRAVGCRSNGNAPPSRPREQVRLAARPRRGTSLDSGSSHLTHDCWDLAGQAGRAGGERLGL